MTHQDTTLKEELKWRFPDVDMHEIYHVSHRQPHEARYVGWEYATKSDNINADYFQFLDDDDFLPPNWYLDTDWDADINWSVARLCVYHIGGEMLGEDRHAKSNAGGVIWKSAVIEKVFSTIPFTIPPFIEPFLYMLVAYHECNPTYHVKRLGVVRGFYGGEDWLTMDVNRITEEHKTFWQKYLSLPAPVVSDSDLSIYFEIYGKGSGPWRVE